MNLLFLMTDHQRADTIGMVQDGKEVTPNLNQLAAASTVFERAYTTCPLCVPARTALATGVYPTQHGVVCNDWRGTNAGDFKPIHQTLREAGYDVGMIGADHIKLKPALMDRGPFHTIGFQDHPPYLKELGIEPPSMDDYRTDILEDLESGPRKSSFSNYRTGLWPLPAEHFLDMFLAREAVSFVNRKRDKHFALFLYLWAPHPPLCVPEPFHSMFDPDRIDLPENVGVVPEGEPPNRRNGIAARMAETATTEDWRKAWSAHLGLTALADAAVGQVLDAAARGDAKETVTMFMSDHGDHMGQHRMYQKMDMYEPALRVPMMMRIPEGTARRVTTPVTHLDVLPTTLDLLGLPAPEGGDGRSLASSVRDGDALTDVPVYAQYSGGGGISDIRRAVVRGRYKYVWSTDDQVELFDLEEDPLEMVNLAGDVGHREEEEEMHGLCRAWAEEHGDWVRL